MEEIRWHNEKQNELNEKVENDEKQVKRQKEHLLNLEENAKELEEKYRRQVRLLGIMSHEHRQEAKQDKFMDHEQVDLLNKILKLEAELQGKEKENKLLNLKMKEQSGLSRGGTLSPKRQVRSASKHKYNNNIMDQSAIEA